MIESNSDSRWSGRGSGIGFKAKGSNWLSVEKLLLLSLLFSFCIGISTATDSSTVSIMTAMSSPPLPVFKNCRLAKGWFDGVKVLMA